MQYQSLGNHIERTSLNTREEIISEAVISNIYKLSPTVKGLDLTVENPNFSFKAGQWYVFPSFKFSAHPAQE